METTYRQEKNRLSRYLNRISWGAIIAGVIVAIIVQLLLSLLGIGIGFVNFTPTSDSQPFSGLGTGVMIWWIVTVLISLFAGGWVSGWLATTTNKIDRLLHGILTWSIFALFSLYVVTTSVGSIIGGVGNVIGKSFSAAGGAIKDSAPDVSNVLGSQLGIENEDLKKLKDEATTLLRQTGKKELQPENLKNKADEIAKDAKQAGKEVGENPKNADDQADKLINKLFNIKDEVLSEVDRDALANIVAERSGKSKAESRETVDNWVNTAEEVKQKVKKWSEEAEQKAKVVGEDVTDALGKFAIFSFFALLLGAGSAVGGSLLSSNKSQYDDAVNSNTASY
ncbi:hypothetical protein ACL9RF_14315 [Sphingobacterium sp. Mn56C]|uniref:YrzE family protein n=1 Tax=Sphingobacterium sp. Mn56C TaxID=3395261 RepID=UPI003BBCBAB3